MTIHDFDITAVGKDIRFKVDLDPSSGTEALMHFAREKLVPEPEVVGVMARALRPGDVVVDGGANVGFFTLLMAKLVGPSGWVHAFEPEPGNRKALVRNIELNNLMQVTLCTKPLWNRPEKLLLHRHADPGQSAIVLEGNEDCSTVWATTLDHELPGGTAPRLLKLDIEGSELRALEGATKLLDNRPPPYIIAEMNEPALALLGSDQMSLRSHLRNWGYETFLLLPNFPVPIFIPAKTILKPHKRSINVLYCTADHFAELWPEVAT